MANTDYCYIEPIYKYLNTNNIYIPVYNVCQDYCDFMEKNSHPDDKLNTDYLMQTTNYTKCINTINIDLEPIYWYVYCILYLDFNGVIQPKLYEKITNALISGDFLKQDKINSIKSIVENCTKTQYVFDGWMEGYILELMEIMIELDMEEEFEKTTNALNNSYLDTHREILSYLIDQISSSNANNDLDILKYIKILRIEKVSIITIGNYLLKTKYYHNPDEIILEFSYNDIKYICSIKEKQNDPDFDIHYLEQIANYFSFIRNQGLTKNEIKIELEANNVVLYLQDSYKFNFIKA